MDQYLKLRNFFKTNLPLNLHPPMIVDKGLLTYSLRERSWLWDIQHIDAEDITPNVLDLLSSKMVNLSQSVQVRCN